MPMISGRSCIILPSDRTLRPFFTTNSSDRALQYRDRNHPGQRRAASQSPEKPRRLLPGIPVRRRPAAPINPCHGAPPSRQRPGPPPPPPGRGCPQPARKSRRPDRPGRRSPPAAPRRKPMPEAFRRRQRTTRDRSEARARAQRPLRTDAPILHRQQGVEQRWLWWAARNTDWGEMGAPLMLHRQAARITSSWNPIRARNARA